VHRFVQGSKSLTELAMMRKYLTPYDIGQGKAGIEADGLVEVGQGMVICPMSLVEVAPQRRWRFPDRGGPCH
jgi:hypothetical protein